MKRIHRFGMAMRPNVSSKFSCIYRKEILAIIFLMNWSFSNEYVARYVPIMN